MQEMRLRSPIKMLGAAAGLLACRQPPRVGVLHVFGVCDG